MARRRSRRGLLGLLICTVALASAPSSAQPAAAQSAPLKEPRSVRHTQAHADRVVLAPSAETQPAGTVFLSSYELVFVQAGYAFSKRLHASLTGLLTGQFFELNVKANVLRSRLLRVAASSSIDYARAEPDDDEQSSPHLLFGRVGATAQLCFELRCRSSLSLSAMLALHDQTEIVLPLGFAAGLTGFVSPEVSLLLEYSSLSNAARELELIDLPVHLLAYGVRLSGNADWALDVALLRRLTSDEEVSIAVPEVFEFLGLPLVAFTYRFES